MLRIVADETPRPAAVTRSDDGTGSPDPMYSRTSAASTRPERSFICPTFPRVSSIGFSTRSLRVLRHYTTGWTDDRGGEPCGPERAPLRVHSKNADPPSQVLGSDTRFAHDFIPINADRIEPVYQHFAVDDGGSDV